MIKFLYDNEKQLIFNYLNSDRSALLSAVTEFYPNSYIPDGVFAAQYDGKDITSVFSNGEKHSILFFSEKSDTRELCFALKDEIHSPDILPFDKAGEYFLLKAECTDKMASSDAKQSNFRDVLAFNGARETDNLHYLFKKGNLLPYALKEIGGGFIINSSDYSVISHVFVKTEHRKKGNGTEIVKNLLNRSSSKKVYLICEKSNLDFYEELGFSPVLTVHKYIK